METDIKRFIAEYWNKRASDYDRTPTHRINSGEEKEEWIKVLKEALGNESRYVLDVGTGTGFLAILLAELGHKVVGIDISKRMLEKAREKAVKLKLDIIFREGDAENVPFSDNTFDTVVCRHVFWTLPNPLKALKEWRRVLKEYGTVVVIDGKWRTEGLKGILREIFWKIGIVVHERRNPFRSKYNKEIEEKLPFKNGVNINDAVNLFKKAGFSNIEVKNLENIRKLQKRRMPLLLRIAYNNSLYMIKGKKVIE